MVLFSVIAMLLLFALVGIAVEKVLAYPFSFTNAIMVGFLATLAVFHVVAYPMVQLDAPFSLLFWVYTVLLILIVLALFWDSSKRKVTIVSKQYVQDILPCVRKEFPLLILTLGVMVVTLFISCGYVYDTSDDSFYLPRAMEIIAQNRLGLYHGLWWSGLSEQSWPPLVDASTMESWKAYWSYLFGMHPTTFCRNTLSIVVHIVSWCSLYQAYKSVSKHRDHNLTPCLFLIVYLILIVFDNRVSNTSAFWTIRYPAQGKSMMCSIIYPALIYTCATIVDCGKGHISWQKWAGISLTFTAGIAMSTIGVFWPFLCCLTMGLPYLIIDRRKDLHRLILPLVLACVPVIIYSGITLLSVVTEHTNYLEIPLKRWYPSLTAAINIQRFDEFLVCFVLSMILGSRNVRLIIIGGCAAMFLTILNPLLTKYVCQYLSTGDAYYRLFWMVPVYFIIAYAVAEVFGGCRQELRQKSIALVVLVLILVGGLGILRYGPANLKHRLDKIVPLTSEGVRRTNPYGVLNSWYQIGEKLLEGTEDTERVRLMWLHTGECDLRQFTERVEVVGGCRKDHWEYFDQPLGTCTISPQALRNTFVQEEEQGTLDTVWLHEQLVASGINYLCVSPYSAFATREIIPQGLEPCYEDPVYKIYRVLE